MTIANRLAAPSATSVASSAVPAISAIATVLIATTRISASTP